MTAKQQVVKTLEELPDDARAEAAMERRYLLYKIEIGIDQADRGELISHEEAQRRMNQWLQLGS